LILIRFKFCYGCILKLNVYSFCAFSFYLFLIFFFQKNGTFFFFFSIFFISFIFFSSWLFWISLFFFTFGFFNFLNYFLSYFWINLIMSFKKINQKNLFFYLSSFIFIFLTIKFVLLCYFYYCSYFICLI
jgi:hypothetical protein